MDCKVSPWASPGGMLWEGGEHDCSQFVLHVCAVSADPADGVFDSAAERSLTFTSHWSAVKTRQQRSVLAPRPLPSPLCLTTHWKGQGSFLIQDHLEALSKMISQHSWKQSP